MPNFETCDMHDHLCLSHASIYSLQNACLFVPSMSNGWACEIRMMHDAVAIVCVCVTLSQ